MVVAKFDIIRDNQLVKDGTHFFCSACVVARPLSEQSDNPRYCIACNAVLEGEKQITKRTPKKYEDLPLFATHLPKIGGSEHKQVKSVARKK